MSDPTWTWLNKLHNRLENNEDVSDEDLIDATTSLKIVTNAHYAAFMLFKAIAPICGHRHHLTDAIAYRPMLPLVYLGIETADGVSRWIERQLSQPNPFDSMNDTGIKWLNWFKTQTELIQQYLDIEISNNDAYFVNLLSEYLMPHSKVERDRIKFQVRWTDKILDSKCAIVFFNFSTDEEIEEGNLFDFENLTSVLAEVDISQQVQFFACDIEVWWDFLERFEDQMFASRFGETEKEKIQVVWILHGKVIHTVEPSAKSNKYKEFTKNLLEQFNG